MAYGIKVTGNDAGGDYTVTDTDNNLINYSVVTAGAGSSVTLDSGITKQPLIFVNAKGVTDASGTYTLTDPGSGTTTMRLGVVVTWNSTTRTAAFFTTRVAWQTSPTFNWISVNTSRSMNYFIAVDSADVPGSQHTSGTYGLQVFTSGGAVAVDSRRFPTNKTYDVNSVLASGSSAGSTITLDEDAYVETSQTFTRPAAGAYQAISRCIIQFGASAITYYGESVDLDPEYPIANESPYITHRASNRPIQVATLT
jgi:hypothetical protein